MFVTTCDDNGEYRPTKQPEKIFDIVQRTEMIREDYILADRLYPDFDVRCSNESDFSMTGEFPPGTRVWLAYLKDPDGDIRTAFLNREQAINHLMKTLSLFVRHVFTDAIEEAQRIYGNNAEEVIQEYRKLLEETGSVRFFNPDDSLPQGGFYTDYIVKELILP